MMTEARIKATRLCKCGNDAVVIKDYWVTESRVKRGRLDNEVSNDRAEYVCGIIRRRFCPNCLSKLASRQIRINRRLDLIILISIFVPLALACAVYGYNYFAKNDGGALAPFIAMAVFTVITEGFLSYKFLTAQKKRSRVQKGELSDLKTVEQIIDSLNYGLDDPNKIKELPSTDIVSDGDGRVNYGMERGGFNIRIMLSGKINIESMTERMKYPFKNEAEYVKRTYVNAGLFNDNMKLPDEKELSANDLRIKNGRLVQYSGLAIEVIIPDNVTAIGTQAFKNSKNCEKIQLPLGVAEIQDEAFSGCPATVINIPSGVRAIKPFTFYHSGINEAIIPEGVEYIEDNAFCECHALERVVIPKSCKKVAQNAFKGCDMLTELVIGEGLESIGDYAFNGCVSLKEVIIPDGVYEIGNFAFEGCASLESLYLPDSIQFMGGRAFDGNINMTVYGKLGSYAEKYAAEQRKRFESTDGKKKFEVNRRIKK